MAAHAHAASPLPRGALIGAAALVTFALVAAIAARLAGPAAGQAPSGVAPVASVELRFADRADGAVIVTGPVADAAPIVLVPGEGNFVRGVLRGFARDRRSRGIGGTEPFVLTHWRDGRLSLQDTATGRRVELGAFGRTNEASFAGLLALRGVAP